MLGAGGRVVSEICTPGSKRLNLLENWGLFSQNFDLRVRRFVVLARQRFI